MELPLLGTYEPVGSEPVGSGTLLVERSETLPTLIIVCNVLRDKRQCGGNPSRPRPKPPDSEQEVSRGNPSSWHHGTARKVKAALCNPVRSQPLPERKLH